MVYNLASHYNQWNLFSDIDETFQKPCPTQKKKPLQKTINSWRQNTIKKPLSNCLRKTLLSGVVPISRVKSRPTADYLVLGWDMERLKEALLSYANKELLQCSVWSKGPLTRTSSIRWWERLKWWSWDDCEVYQGEWSWEKGRWLFGRWRCDVVGGFMS